MDDTELQTCLDVIDGNKPLGLWVDAPAVPATTVPVTNTSGFAMGVEVGANGATITAVKIDGVTIGAGTVPRVSGRYRVRNGSTIALTYTVATPTMQWFYE
jgi:hypothetical protein